MAKIDLEINAKTKKATKNIQSFASRAKASLSKISGAIFSLKGLAVGLAGAFLFKKLADGLTTVAGLASVQEDAINKLNTAMKVAGDFSLSASKDLQTFASNLQQVTIIGDETTLEMLSLAKAFGTTNEGAKDLVSAAVELSSATGKDLRTSLELLGKTTGGSLGRLAEFVPSLKNMSKESLIAGGAIKKVFEQFSGSALGQIQTFSGATTQLSNVFGDFQEELGFVVTKNKSVISAVKGLTKFFTILGKEVSNNRGGLGDALSSIFVGFINQIPSAITATKTFVLAIVTIAEAVNIAIASVSRFFEEFLKSETTIIALTNIGDAFTAIGLSIAEVANFVRQIKTLFTFGNASKEMKALEDQMNELKSTFKELINGFGKSKIDLSKLTNKVTDFADKTEERVKKISELKVKLDNAFVVGENIGKSLASNVVSAVQKSIDSSKIDISKSLSGSGSGPIFELKASIAPEINQETFTRILQDAAQQQASGGTLITADASIERVEISDSALEQMSKEAQSVFSKSIDFLAKNSKAIFAGAGSLVSDISKGAEGATNFLVKGGASLANTFASGAGAFVGPLLELASMGKDQVIELVNGFVDAIPVLLTTIVEALPVIFEKIADALPDIIIAIVDALPDVLIALVNGIGKLIIALVEKSPEIIGSLGRAILSLAGSLVGFVLGMLKEGLLSLGDGLGVITDAIGEGFSSGVSAIGEEFDRFISNVKDAFNFDGGGKGASGRTADKIKNVFGFAKGGEIPSGFPNDSFPAQLTSGELVVPNDTVGNLKSFIKNNDGTNALLSRILDKVSNGNQGPQQISLEINGEVLSNALVELDRNSERLTA